MPRIAAATVREHRENVRAALIDAAETIVRTQGADALTAGAVTKAAGIARNSIYRYVDSVDDLRGLVLERHLPGWESAVSTALAVADNDPADRIEAWCRANLEHAAATGHDWLIALAKGVSVGAQTRDAVDHAHREAEDVLGAEWRRLLGVGRPGTHDDDTGADSAVVRQAVIGAELTRSLVDGGLRLLDHGQDLNDVSPAVLACVRDLLASASASAAG